MSEQFSLASSTLAAPLGPAVKPSAPADAPPVRRYLKPIYRLGTFTHPKKGWTLNVTPERMTGHLSQFQKMKLAGIPVKLTKDHKRDADSVVGDVLDLLRGKLIGDVFEPAADGDWMGALTEVTGQKNIDLVEANKDVSVEIDPFKLDHAGAKYGEHVSAVSIVPNPLVPGQSGFQRIAADDGDDTRPTTFFPQESLT